MKIVLKLGGHTLFEKPTTKSLQPYLNAIKTLSKKGHRVAVVTGGGRIAREYISIARGFESDESFCDEIGINIARINAFLIISGLGELAWPQVPESLEEAAVGFQSGRVIVMGGLTPGHSTTAVAALVAERLDADLLVITSDVDGIYTEDPKKSRNASKIESVTPRELYRILMGSGSKAGEYEMLDMVSLSIIDRSKIRTIVLDGRRPENILKAVGGAKIGTKVG